MLRRAQMAGLRAPRIGRIYRATAGGCANRRDIANNRAQILREQNIRTKKHITLDEIGRRLAIGSFKELNVIVKGDVDGSVEALSDSLLKLSREKGPIQGTSWSSTYVNGIPSQKLRRL